MLSPRDDTASIVVDAPDSVLEGTRLPATLVPVPRRLPLRLHPEARTYRWTMPLLALIVAGGTVLRVYGLDRLGFNSDEAVYAGQAASIARVKSFTPFFPIYRAHPLLYQALLSLIYRFEVSDFAARLLAVLGGLATVVLGYSLGKVLYGRRAGLATAAVLAIMPYHVITTRQALLDGTETLFATLALYALARYSLSKNPRWMYALGAALGLTFLSKETGIVLVAAVFAFLALSPDVPTRIRDLAGTSAVFGAIVFIYPLSIALGGASRTGKSFFVWQLVRRPNHSYLFYFTTALPAMGFLVITTAIVGIAVLWRDRSWRETLLLSWALVPLAFFTLWPVKGFQYLLPIAPAVAVLAGRVLGQLPIGRGFHYARVTVSVILLMTIGGSLVEESWSRISPSTSDTFLAGSGGVPGGREAGTWLRTNVPADARLLALGPSMANILQFYGNRKVWGLSVSTNPLRRNPVYQPVGNPDLAIRRGDIQYLVWDSYSANRSPTFGAQLLGYVNRFHGRAVHTQSVASGSAKQPVIVIYSVQP
ncbi:MAG: hypothetical protein JWL83_3838 [Actinomycetia bacterium]|nr:hypothetical protein [Actinomycetes bacterium]